MDVGPDRDVGPLSLRETLGAVSFVGTGDIRASRFVCDSREVRPGDVFFALQGTHFNGRQFIDDAILAGASAVVVDRPVASIAVPQCIVADPRAAYSRIYLRRCGQPQKNLTIAGVTGTNGKTTTTWLLRSIFEAAGLTTGLMGTIEYSDGVSRTSATLTTPTSEQIASLLAQMKSRRASHCVMEISSHALDQSRCAGVELAAAAVTNVTQDHFDYHGNRHNYLAAKAKMATLLQPGRSLLLGIDDPGCRELQTMLPSRTDVLTFGFAESASLRAELLPDSGHITTLRLKLLSSALTIRTPIVGRHNALNLLLAAGMAEQLGIDPAAIAEGLEQTECVPGRMERIDAGQNFTVLVDYAHTPDGLGHCVATAREITRREAKGRQIEDKQMPAGRVILVFGAGGNRDRAKRPLMAQAAESADLVIVTSDNPRSEIPLSIISDICDGFQSMDRVTVRVDRQQAIQTALQMARQGDVVMIAGRGHESTQEIGTRRICFDDRKVARRLLLELLNGPSEANSSRTLGVPA